MLLFFSLALDTTSSLFLACSRHNFFSFSRLLSTQLLNSFSSKQLLDRKNKPFAHPFSSKQLLDRKAFAHSSHRMDQRPVLLKTKQPGYRAKWQKEYRARERAKQEVAAAAAAAKEEERKRKRREAVRKHRAKKGREAMETLGNVNALAPNDDDGGSFKLAPNDDDGSFELAPNDDDDDGSFEYDDGGVFEHENDGTVTDMDLLAFAKKVDESLEESLREAVALSRDSVNAVKELTAATVSKRSENLNRTVAALSARKAPRP